MATRINGIEFLYEGKAMIATDTPSDVFPVGSECPHHLREHNAHGWYVCLSIHQVLSAFGSSYLMENNGEFVE